MMTGLTAEQIAEGRRLEAEAAERSAQYNAIAGNRSARSVNEIYAVFLHYCAAKRAWAAWTATHAPALLAAAEELGRVRGELDAERDERNRIARENADRIVRQSEMQERINDLMLTAPARDAPEKGE